MKHTGIFIDILYTIIHSIALNEFQFLINENILIA